MKGRGETAAHPMSELIDILGQTDKKLLEEALTHSSYLNENRSKAGRCYERLEFLGDSVLGMLTAEKLYCEHGNMSEGGLTRLRASLVCEPSLAKAAKNMKLGTYLRLGRGEELSGGRERPSILADAVEAVVAAVYLSRGIDAARAFVNSYVLPETTDAGLSDYKTTLQERAQAASSQPLVYRLTGESGPDHEKIFTVEVFLGDKRLGAGTGGSKKEAEQSAAREALEKKWF